MGSSAVEVKLEHNLDCNVKEQNVVHPPSSATSKASRDSTKATSEGKTLSLLRDQPCNIKRVPSKRKRKILNDTCDSHKYLKHGLTTVESTLHDEDVKSLSSSSYVERDTRPNKLNFSLRESFHQSTKKTIYSLTFSEPHQQCMNTDPAITYLLATCSHRNLVLYSITTEANLSEGSDTTANETDPISQQRDHSNSNSCVQYCYVDTDENEDYYACTFIGRIPTASSNNEESTGTSTQLICVGGKNARINVIDYSRNQVTRTLSGHGGEILDLQVCPTDEWLLLSASQDYSCRLWNVRAVHDAPIAIFSGHNGHGDGVTTLSWHVSGAQFVSGGIDNVIKIWEISDDIRDAIISSNNLTDSVLNSTNVIDHVDWIATIIVQFPLFSTNRMHAHCVDCVEFLGDLIVSKSTENVVQLWYPIIQNKKSPFGDILQPPSSDAILLQTFHYLDGDFWFIRFAIEPQLKLLAVGTSHGGITIWKMCDDNYQSVLKPIRNLHIHRHPTVRCVRFSPDGTMLFASTDDGSIYKWSVS
jgi:polycomb protein EED